MMRGLLFALSGPSGVGKGTIYHELLKRMDNLSVSVSATTRAPRPGETDGKHYHFISRDKFLKMVERGEFLEYAETVGNLYGTPRRAVEEKLAGGINVLLEIDVKGVRQVMLAMPECITIFILPPSLAELEHRLRGRRTESEEQLQKRLALAREELTQADKFDYQVMNDNLEASVLEVMNIINRSTSR